MGNTTALRRVLKSRFHPHANARGFAIDERLQPRSTSFRRQAGDRVHIFDVQWDKYGRPRFLVTFGTCPASGLDVNGVTHSPADTLPSWCPDAGSLQPRRGTSTASWFRQDVSWLRRLLGHVVLRPADDVVDELLAVFPELENYWDTGAIGAHMRPWWIGTARKPGHSA